MRCKNLKKADKIILVMTDTQRKDMLGCYGNADMYTPNLDKLADEGIRFERAYTCQPVCGPARAALFTGTYPHTNGSTANTIALSQITKHVGERFSDEGWKSAYIGKWHLDGGDYFGDGICPLGWDEDYWYDMKCYLDELSEDDRYKSRFPETAYDDKFTEEFTYGHRVSDRAIDFLSKSTEDNFLLVVSYDEPHHPFLSPKEYYKRYADYSFPKTPNVWDTLDDKPEHLKAWAGERLYNDKDAIDIKLPHFFGANSYVDYEIGRVLDAARKYAPDAMVIYTADHGDALESHSITNKGAAMFQEITNIPFIVKWPGFAPSGCISENMVSHINIVPTMMEAAGIYVPEILEGKSMTAMFENPKISIDEEVFIEFTRYEIDHDGFGGFQPIRCAVSKDYKLVINLLSSDELYDLKNDPYEMVNLINNPDYNDIRDGLHDKILDWMNDTRDPYRGYYWERRPWRSDARDATWDYTLMTRQRVEEPGQLRQLDYSTGLEIDKHVRLKGEFKKRN